MNCVDCAHKKAGRQETFLRIAFKACERASRNAERLTGRTKF